jgi:hypothetical protein
MHLLRAVALLLFLTQLLPAGQPTPILPDPKLTPGDTFDVTAEDVCVPGYAKKVRNVGITSLVLSARGRHSRFQTVPVSAAKWKDYAAAATAPPDPAQKDPGGLIYRPDYVRLVDDLCNVKNFASVKPAPAPANRAVVKQKSKLHGF